MGIRIDSVPLQCVAGVLVFSLCSTQSVFAAGPMDAAPPDAPAKALTVPAGTVVPLTLINPVHSKSTKAGDEVRAQVAFPVSVGSQVAIPQGAYVEGTLVSATPATRKKPAALKVHFTRLIFANGYTAALDAVNTAAVFRGTPTEQVAANKPAPYYPYGRGARFYGPDPGFGAQATTQPQPLPSVGPSKGLVIGLAAAGTAAIIVISAVVTHNASSRAKKMDTVLFDTGWQFDMKLDSPVALDAAKTSAAAAVNGSPS